MNYCIGEKQHILDYSRLGRPSRELSRMYLRPDGSTTPAPEEAHFLETQQEAIDFATENGINIESEDSCWAILKYEDVI